MEGCVAEALSREEERARMARALMLVEEARLLTDSYAPAAYASLSTAAAVLRAMISKHS